MNDATRRTAVVTGATSGLGFEAAAQLAEAGYSPVTITGRTKEKAAAARSELVARTGLDVFETLALDLSLPSDVEHASNDLAGRTRSIDLLLLNAGMVSGNDIVRATDGVEMTFASSLVGHHNLTMRLLGAGGLADGARIVIAGSEAARGDVPTFNVTDLADLGEAHFGGDLEAAARSLIRQEKPVRFKPGNAYADAKLFVAWWAAALARRLPAGMTVNAVSPGSAPDTQAIRNANFFMKRIMVPVFRHAPARFGMAAPVSEAAARYLQAADFGDDVTGQFWASAPKKMTGPIEQVTLPHVLDAQSQEAAWDAIVSIAGGVTYPAAA